MSVTLFSVSRNINSNIVNYDLQLDQNNTPTDVVAYWVMYETDKSGSVTEDLTMMENKFAYGIDVTKVTSSPARVYFNLKQMPDMPLTVFYSKKQKEWVAGANLSQNGICTITRVEAQIDFDKVIPMVKGLTVHALNTKNQQVSEWIPVNRSMQV